MIQDDADFAALGASHVVGDVATVFYREDGSTDNIPMNDRASGPDFETLRHASRRICVVAGASKIPAIRGALAARHVTHLIIDENTGRALLGE